jgi:hypothetical protein
LLPSETARVGRASLNGAAAKKEDFLMSIYPEIEDPIPIGMLLAEVTFFPDDSAELFGFATRKPPSPKPGKKRRCFRSISPWAGAVG